METDVTCNSDSLRTLNAQSVSHYYIRRMSVQAGLLQSNNVCVVAGQRFYACKLCFTLVSYCIKQQFKVMLRFAPSLGCVVFWSLFSLNI